MLTRSRTLRLAAANDGSSFPQPDNEKSKQEAARRTCDAGSKNHTSEEFFVVPGVDMDHTSSSTPSKFPSCCSREWKQEECPTSPDCICAAFESCIRRENFRRDDNKKKKHAYFLQVQTGYICISCHHQTGCQIRRDKPTQMNLQAAARHLSNECGTRKKTEKGCVANVFVFKWDVEGKLMVTKKFVTCGGSFDYIKFQTFISTYDKKKVQDIRNDLVSRNPINVNSALHHIPNMESREMVEAFCTDLPKLLVSGETIDFVKQSAALCILKLFRNSPESFQLGEYVSRIVNLLNDSHMGVVTSAASLIEALSKKWPEEYKGAVPLAISRLSRVVTAADTDLQDEPQWLCVKLLRLLQNYPSPDDPSDKDRLLECLEGILNKVQDAPKSKKVQHSNAKKAVLFEAIALIIHMDSEPQLLVRVCDQLGTFLSHRETSMRYRALESMCLLATSEFSHDAIKKHQDTIINSLKTERDVSVRQRAVDLLYAMCDRSNANQIVAEMLTHLETADNSVKEETVLKVALLAEKYATDYTWYVDVILKLIRIAGDYVSKDAWHRDIQIVVNREDVQEYAAKTVFEALQRPACHENMVKVGGYILGEFGNFIAGDERSTSKIQFELLHSKFHLCSITTRCLLLTTYIKFCNLFPEIKPLVQQVFQTDHNLKSPDAELQQQSFEYLQMTKLVEDLLATVRTVKVEVEEGDDGSQDVMPAARTALLAAFQKLAADLRLPIDADKLNRKMVLNYKIFKIVEVTSILEKSIKIIQNSDNVDPGTHFDPLDCVKLHVFFLLLQTNFKNRNLNDFQSIRDNLQKAVEASENGEKWISLSTITPCLEKIIDTLIAEPGLACVL